MPDRRKCIAVAANSIAKITKATPLTVTKARMSPRPPPTEPGFDGKRDAADEEHRRQGRVKAKQ